MALKSEFDLHANGELRAPAVALGRGGRRVRVAGRRLFQGLRLRAKPARMTEVDDLLAPGGHVHERERKIGGVLTAIIRAAHVMLHGGHPNDPIVKAIRNGPDTCWLRVRKDDQAGRVNARLKFGSTLALRFKTIKTCKTLLGWLDP
jgi:hypothetical protein